MRHTTDAPFRSPEQSVQVLAGVVTFLSPQAECAGSGRCTDISLPPGECAGAEFRADPAAVRPRVLTFLSARAECAGAEFRADPPALGPRVCGSADEPAVPPAGQGGGETAGETAECPEDGAAGAGRPDLLGHQVRNGLESIDKLGALVGQMGWSVLYW